MKGSTYRRCYCRGADGKTLGSKCPKLTSKRHGVWSLKQELPPRADGSRRAFRRSGFENATKAQAMLNQVRALLDLPDADDGEAQAGIGDLLEEVSGDAKAPLPDLEEVKRKYRGGQSLTSQMTVGEWLEEWVGSKKTRTTTTKGYRSHIRVHLGPGLGDYRLDRLHVGHVQDFFDAIDDLNEVILAENAARREQEARATWGKRSRPPAAEAARLAVERGKLAAMKPYRRPTRPATKQRIRATLRTALNAAIRRRLIAFNPASHVELASGKRPKAQLWTEQRVAHWRATGEKPSAVMVWTPSQIGAFLDAAEESRLYAFFHLIAFRGLRRGEGVGLGWVDVDLDAQTLTVAKAIVVDGWTPVESDPKTEESAGTIALDSLTVGVLREHRERQRAEREKLGAAWTETGKVFTQEDGAWLHPEKVSDEFRRICKRADLPPINLRDLRHCAATLIHAGGGDIHVIKETLRHSDIRLASNTYTSLLGEVDLEIAERAAALVPRARKAPAGTPGLASVSQRADGHSG